MTVLRCEDMNVGVRIDRFLSTPFALRGASSYDVYTDERGQKVRFQISGQRREGFDSKEFRGSRVWKALGSPNAFSVF